MNVGALGEPELARSACSSIMPTGMLLLLVLGRQLVLHAVLVSSAVTSTLLGERKE